MLHVIELALHQKKLTRLSEKVGTLQLAPLILTSS
jgi:hypothetical protein